MLLRAFFKARKLSCNGTSQARSFPEKNMQLFWTENVGDVGMYLILGYSPMDICKIGGVKGRERVNPLRGGEHGRLRTGYK